jgi:hypothetical protein
MCRSGSPRFASGFGAPFFLARMLRNKSRGHFRALVRFSDGEVIGIGLKNHQLGVGYFSLPSLCLIDWAFRAVDGDDEDGAFEVGKIRLDVDF